LRWFRRRSLPALPVTQGTVIFLADSFTTFTEPDIGRAAIELLERAGWRVQLEGGGCCGRSSLSKGLVDDAKDKARKLAHSLCATGEPGSPIVGCEPSCLMTLRDEHLALLPDDVAVRPGAGCFTTATATRKRRSAPPRPLRCSSESRESRLTNSTPVVAAWPDPSDSNPNTTRCQ
jgi:Fe-S oxidoreductase